MVLSAPRLLCGNALPRHQKGSVDRFAAFSWWRSMALVASFFKHLHTAPGKLLAISVERFYVYVEGC